MNPTFDNEIRLWIVDFNKEVKPITQEEKKIARNLPPIKAREYTLTRGYARYALSKLFKIPALDIPLDAPLGKPPSLRNDLGHISLSHCKNALLIGWAKNKLGVDIERKDRLFSAKDVSKKFYSSEEICFLENMRDEHYRYNTLKFWVIKEAAIKWQRGNISNDLSKWEVKNNFKLALHNSLEIELKTNLCELECWLIGIAYKNHEIKKKEIVSKIL